MRTRRTFITDSISTWYYTHRSLLIYLKIVNVQTTLIDNCVPFTITSFYLAVVGKFVNMSATTHVPNYTKHVIIKRIST